MTDSEKFDRLIEAVIEEFYKRAAKIDFNVTIKFSIQICRMWF